MVRLRIYWGPLASCNYNCPYCSTPACAQAAEAVAPAKWGPADVYQMVEDIASAHGPTDWDIGGPEPTQETWLLAALLVPQGNSLVVSSNMSFLPEELFSDLPAERVLVCASFHPYAVQLPEFLEKIVQCRIEGAEVPSASVVGYPPLLENFPTWKRMMEAIGVLFVPHAFIGEYEGRTYPAAYSDEEWVLLAGGAEKLGMSLKNRASRQAGGRCAAGWRYVWANRRGDAFRCIGNREPRGSLFEGLTLDDEPKPCDREECPCPNVSRTLWLDDDGLSW